MAEEEKCIFASQSPDKRLDPWLAKMRKRRKSNQSGLLSARDLKNDYSEVEIHGKLEIRVSKEKITSLIFLIINKIILNGPK